MIQLEKPTVVIRHSRYPEEEEKKKTVEAPSLAGSNLFINNQLLQWIIKSNTHSYFLGKHKV